MSYADIQDLRTRLGSLYADIYPASETAAVQEDLADAQAEINGALAIRYTVPVTGPAEVLTLLKSWTLALAAEFAFSRTAGNTCPEKIRQRAEKVRERLAEIREGHFLLAGAQERNTASLVCVSMDHPVFGRDTMKRF